MNKFTYQATNINGKVVKGVIEKDSKQEVLLHLRSDGLYPVEVKPLKDLNISIDIFENWQKVSNKDVMLFIVQLSTMLKAGMSLIFSFDVIIGQVKNKKFKKIIIEIKKTVSKGVRLSEACKQHSKVFPPLFSNIVRAGEESGKLELVLDRYAQFIEKNEKIKSEIRNILIYPSFLLGLCFVVIGFLTNVVIPNFADIIKSSGSDLPGTTKFLLTLNAYVREHIVLIIISIILLIIGLMMFLRTEVGSYYFDLFKLKIPLLGTIYYKSVISRFVRTLNTLLISGIPFLKNLKLSTNVINNKVITNKITATFDNIIKGEKIANEFEKTKIFSPIIIQMISTGENSGTLDLMFEEIANIYDREIDTSIKRLTSAIEPIVLAIVAGCISFIAVSLVSSVMKAINSYK